MAEVFDETLGRRTTRQIGALPVVYPILETMRLREIVNELRYTGADIDLGRIAELAPKSRCSTKQEI